MSHETPNKPIKGTPPPHPNPHTLIVAFIRTDERHIQRRLNTVMGVAATYDEPPNTTPHIFAKFVHELTVEDLGAVIQFIGDHGLELLNLWDQYPERIHTNAKTNPTNDNPDEDYPPTELYDQEQDQAPIPPTPGPKLSDVTGLAPPDPAEEELADRIAGEAEPPSEY